MKGWMSFGLGVLMTGATCLGAYTIMNKNTKSKADKVINSMLDKVNNSNIMK